MYLYLYILQGVTFDLLYNTSVGELSKFKIARLRVNEIEKKNEREKKKERGRKREIREGEKKGQGGEREGGRI